MSLHRARAFQGFDEAVRRKTAAVQLLYLLILPAVPAVALLLWYFAILAWAHVLHRVAQSPSTWQELDERTAR